MQIDSCCLPLTYECHLVHIYEYLAMLVIVVIRRCYCWLGLFASIPWQLPSILWKLDCRKEVFKPDPAPSIEALS